MVGVLTNKQYSATTKNLQSTSATLDVAYSNFYHSKQILVLAISNTAFLNLLVFWTIFLIPILITCLVVWISSKQIQYKKRVLKTKHYYKCTSVISFNTIGQDLNVSFLQIENIWKFSLLLFPFDFLFPCISQSWRKNNS